MKKLNKKEWIATGVAVSFVLYMFYANNITNLFQANANTGNSMAFLNMDSFSEVMITEIVSGEGREVREGDLLTINYILSLTDGRTIANTKDFGAPFSFVLGSNDVIVGLNDGVVGMKKGEIRTIIIPPQLGFGSVANGPIPADSTLVFTVELIEISQESENKTE